MQTEYNRKSVNYWDSIPILSNCHYYVVILVVNDSDS